jgi:hypothetical protein
LALKPDNLEYVDQDWVALTERDKRFQQHSMIQKFGAPGRYPPKLTELSSHSSHPSYEQLTAFWGENVFEYMRARLVQVIEEKAASRGKSGLFWDFINSGCETVNAMVFSDGSKGTQQLDLMPANMVGSIWWPVLMPANQTHHVGFPESEKILCSNKVLIPIWCQEQAVQGARPYYTHPDRIIVFANYPYRQFRNQPLIQGQVEEIEINPKSEIKPDEEIEPDEEIFQQSVTIEEGEPDEEIEY